MTNSSSKQASSPRRFARLFHSVRFRLSLWYVVILAVVVLVFGSVIYSVEAASLSGEVDAELKFIGDKAPMGLSTAPGQFKLADQLAQTIEQFTSRKLPEPILNQIQGVPLIEGVLQGKFVIVLVDGEGRLTQSFGALEPGQLDPLRGQVNPTATGGYFGLFSAPSAAGQSGQDYRTYSLPVRQANGLAGTIIVGLPWDGARTLQTLLLALLLTGAVTIILAAAGGYWLASRAMQPVSEITRTARTISETDLNRRLNSPRQDEIGELAGTFDRMLSRLQAAFERQRQFTADASHELRTPLTIINLEVNRSLARPRTPEEYARALSVIRVENEYMTHLVEDLLILARADTGQTTLHIEQVDLSDLALEVVERLAPLANRQSITLRTGELPEVLIPGDRHYLTRLLANLVENAIKYTAGSGDSVWVETGRDSGAAGQAAWAWLRVTDNGPGIAPTDLPHLFERFYQADRSRTAPAGSSPDLAGSNGGLAALPTPTAGAAYAYQPRPVKPQTQTGAVAPSHPLSEGEVRGSGLGLAIVKWVVEAHRGSVTVQSQPGQGATFEVRLPGGSSR
jgi:signal transduction histidine kinase